MKKALAFLLATVTVVTTQDSQCLKQTCWDGSTPTDSCFCPPRVQECRQEECWGGYPRNEIDCYCDDQCIKGSCPDGGDPQGFDC